MAAVALAAAAKAEDESQKCVGCKGCGGGQEDETPPVVMFVDEVLKDALHRKAEELELVPSEKIVLLQYRLPERTLPVCELSPLLGRMTTARIKILSQLDIRDRKQPQQGLIRDYPGGPKRMRAGTWPEPEGERVVVRFAPGKLSERDSL